MQRYNDEVKANKEHRTWCAYRNWLQHFLASCLKMVVQQVTREDLLAFKTYCKPSMGHADSTIYNNFLNVKVFLKWANHPMGIKSEDWPKKPKADQKSTAKRNSKPCLGRRCRGTAHSKIVLVFSYACG